LATTLVGNRANGRTSHCTVRTAQVSPHKKVRTRKKVERGWREVFRVLSGNISQHRLTAIAGGVTYFALLAMFPFIGAVVAVYGLFGDAAALGPQLNQLSSVCRAEPSRLSETS